MPERYALFDRVKGVEREYLVASQAVAHHIRAVRVGDVVLPRATSLRDLEAAASGLEATYLIRMWAEFETALRSYRRHLERGPDDRIATSNLIDWAAGVKQGRAISTDARDAVHEVREHRNFLVHERDHRTPPVAVGIEAARQRLNTFLQKLPERW